MKGVFVNWTKPYQERARLRGHAFKMQREQKSEEYITTDEELLFTILSVGYWKEFNGKTKLFTDRDGLKYYVKNKNELYNNYLKQLSPKNYDTNTKNILDLPIDIQKYIFETVGDYDTILTLRCVCVNFIKIISLKTIFFKSIFLFVWDINNILFSSEIFFLVNPFVKSTLSRNDVIFNNIHLFLYSYF